ncbi:HypC/HybG/HupF family hydrogenase formation chaperone [Desulfurispirillum indicum]|uniref:Hydrogenase assembly chaperone hypC/hupF n=1 Tax=Desulfurispirillum indicum (strain ATCC BAA-1389 / DSM 22839 / S5) TaxID=653733 RepID=E6W5K2_DESIS|nr:HypC/HybG/HupF family hydrogenase formation chaperone [Desulfurispirillum indicum]ADU66033.1 hydrogenase assembly chaperone hypC/hupF [Desulfurispirillum indicum S5]UCZ57971.1 HypC/HybG/HupF family hydrogenase formation chaperone [Desulfurispirillum indicum]
MCLSIPSEILSIDENNMALIDTMGVRRHISLDLMPEPVEVGDFILLHVGFAIGKISREEALASLETYRELLEQMENRDGTL